jgi:hypothetical protein
MSLGEPMLSCWLTKAILAWESEAFGVQEEGFQAPRVIPLVKGPKHGLISCDSVLAPREFLYYMLSTLGRMQLVYNNFVLTVPEYLSGQWDSLYCLSL